jgi:putative transposase
MTRPHEALLSAEQRKLERWHGALKRERYRLTEPGMLDDARSVVRSFVAHYNVVRLHSALGYTSPADKLAGAET